MTGSDRLVHRVAALLHRPPAQDGHDEQTAARRLGYQLRSDHPWRRSELFNQQRPSVAEPDGSCGELVFEGAAESTQ
jgi:hypothetical protein